MAGETTLTIVGNLTADPEIRTIGTGATVANFTVASTPRAWNRQTNQYEDGQALFMRCSAWRDLAAHIAQSLKKGVRVIVTGRLQQRSYQAQARLAAKAGSNDFEWRRNRLRRERDRREWVEAARLWAESNDLPMLPDNLKPEDMWANPTGYERQRRLAQDYPGPFSKQWRDWQAEGKHPGAVIRIFDDEGSVVAYTPAKKTAEEREDGKAEAKRRMERERRHKVRELAQASAELRCEWIRTTIPVLKADALRDMTERLTLLELMGVGDSMRGTSLDSNGWTRVVKAYSLFARPLPVVDKDPEHGVYTLNVAENALELRRRQSVPSRRGVELLLLLLARREGAIDADTWDREAYQCDLKGLNAYYEVLESAGYAVSDAERKGLEQ